MSGLIELRTANNFADEQHRLHGRMTAIIDGADGRSFTAEETTEYRNLETALDKSLEESKAAVERAALKERLNNSKLRIVANETEERRNRPNSQGRRLTAGLAAAAVSAAAAAGNGSRDLSQIYAEEGWQAVLETPEYRNLFADVIRSGDPSGYSIIHKACPELRTITTATANVAIPNVMQQRIVELMQPLSPLFDMMPRLEAPEAGSVPVETGIGTAAWVADGVAVTLGDPTQTLKAIVMKTLGTGVSVSRTMVDANAYPLEEYLARKLSQRLRNGFESGALKGTGAGNEPLGIIPNLVANFAGQIFTAPATGSLVANNAFDIEYKILPEWRIASRLRWVINDSSLREFRLLKDTTGQYIWKLADAADLRLGIPGTLIGYPYNISGYFDAPATTKVFAILGDWSFFECYLRKAMELFVDPYSNAKERLVNFYAWMRMDFLLTQGVAFGAGKYT